MKTNTLHLNKLNLTELGRQENLALFFLDIKDFTPFTESHSGFDIVVTLRRLFQIFKEAIESYDGTIIETTGDGLYAVFGFHSGTAVSVCNAIKARNKIVRTVARENMDYFIPFFNHAFEVGVGLHFGKVVVANVHSDDKKNLSVMGYPVNIASRLQDATRRLNNNFIVSQDAYQHIKAARFHDMETLNLKGIRNKIRVFLMGVPFGVSNSDYRDVL